MENYEPGTFIGAIPYAIRTAPEPDQGNPPVWKRFKRRFIGIWGGQFPNRKQQISDRCRKGLPALPINKRGIHFE